MECMSDYELRKRFTYVAPKEGQPELYVKIRDMAHNMAQFIVNHSPVSREQSLAITKIEEAVMWANAGIARNG